MSDKHHILLVVRWPIGGIRSFLRYVYKHFDSSRYRFTLLMPEDPERKPPDQPSEHQAVLHDLAGLDLSYVTLPPRHSPLDFVKRLLSILRSQKIDLIHSHGWTAGVYATLPALLLRIPHVLTLHELLYPDEFKGWTGAAKLKVLSGLLSRVNVIHFVSYEARNNTLRFLPGLKNGKAKLVSILNGVDIPEYWGDAKRDLRAELKLSENTFLIGFLGRFMPVKGFKYLIDALQDLIRGSAGLGRKPVVVTFGWGGFIREEMEEVRKRGLEKSVLSLPFTPNVASALRSLDVIVMPSLSESCGLLAMEAMVAGAPVIGTDCPGLKEVLEGTPAVMVPMRNGTALAEALSSEIKNSSRSKVKAFREEAARRFDVKKQAAELEKIMLELVRYKQSRNASLL